MRKILGATAVLAVLVTLAGCSTGTPTFSATGQLSLPTEGSAAAGQTCYPGDGYDDIAEGTQVVVTDAAGKTVGMGHLSAGETGSYFSCVFHFKVTGIPVGAKFYKVEVGHRGAVQYTEADMHHKLDLSLG